MLLLKLKTICFTRSTVSVVCATNYKIADTDETLNYVIQQAEFMSTSKFEVENLLLITQYMTAKLKYQS